MAYETATEPEARGDDPKEDRPSKPWLDLIDESTHCLEVYQTKCDAIDKLYADLKARSGENADREFQIFWANLEVLKPSMYSRPPVPVVVPRFKDRKELPRLASEVLERCLISSFELDDIDASMRMVRDDLATNARGVIWVRYETTTTADGVTQRVRKEHIDRKDFRHDPAREWKEVEWAARGTWLTLKKGLKRFGEVFRQAEFTEQKTDKDGHYKGEKKARVWELWHKGEEKVVWVTKGVDECLDMQAPFLALEGFFPCPRPAYGTLERASLVPVPDFLYYKDQVEEINELTARISSLSESLRLKGFYPAGVSEVGEAIELALKDLSNNATLIGLSNFAAMGGQTLKDSIVWLPVREVAEVVRQLIELRRQLIDDVYQITGLSDIMRGATDPNETLGAQQIKSQYGSVRIRDRQNELVRIARDVTRIEAEIMAENFRPETLLAMSQMDTIPTDAAIAQEAQGIQQKLQQAQSDPRIQQMAQQNPEQAQQLMQQAQARLAELQGTVTIEKIVGLLRSQRVRPFVLEIETDSTIQPDENAAKQRATEMVTAVGGYMAQTMPMVQTVPEAAPVAAEFLKFLASQFRAGRQLDGVIDEFADKMKALASQPKPPGPDQAKAEADKALAEQEAAAKQQESQARINEINARAQADAVQGQQKIRLGELQIQLAEVNLIAAGGVPRPPAQPVDQRGPMGQVPVQPQQPMQPTQPGAR